jgi:hypothetical protein
MTSKLSSKSSKVKLYDVNDSNNAEGDGFPSGNKFPDIRIHELDLNSVRPRDIDAEYGSRIVAIGKPGCFAYNTKVLMFNGDVKNIQDIKVGEMVMGDDSTPRTVLELCRGFDDMYDIIPTINGVNLDHLTYRVNSKHILTLKRKNKEDITTVDVMLSTFINRKESDITFYGFKNCIDYEVYNNLNLGISEKDAYKYGRYINIHDEITPELLYSETNIRYQLLDGLIKSCGYIRKDYHYNVALVSHSEELSSQILFLINSLGYDAYKSSKINGHFVFASIHEDTENFTYHFNIVKRGKEKYYGFILDGNSRFLLSNGTVVHNTGKSKLTGSILWHKRHIFPIGQVYSGSEESNEAYKLMFPPLNIFNKLDENALTQFKQRQSIAKKHLRVEDGYNPWAVQIWDDLSSDTKFFSKPIVKDYYKNGRHWKMLHINSQQYSLDLKPDIRTCIDGTFLLRESNSKNRKKLYENYAGIVGTFDDFNDIMDELTTDHTSVYINNLIDSNNIEDCVFYYKADLEKIPMKRINNNMEFDFRVGCPEFWKYSDIRVRPELRD